MAKTKKKTVVQKDSSKPKFPYTAQPSELKRLLQLIPTKPKPPKLVTSTAQAWGIKNNSVGTTIGVLKEIGLLDPSGTPTEDYSAYMASGTGGLALGQKIKERYKQLFDTHLEPQNTSNEELKTFFNINSGGAEATIDYQVKTFKALSEFASFDGTYNPTSALNNQSSKKSGATQNSGPQIHFDLHIHLPEGKNSSDYEAIIRAISDNIIVKFKSN